MKLGDIYGFTIFRESTMIIQKVTLGVFFLKQRSIPGNEITVSILILAGYPVLGLMIMIYEDRVLQ